VVEGVGVTVGGDVVDDPVGRGVPVGRDVPAGDVGLAGLDSEVGLGVAGGGGVAGAGAEETDGCTVGGVLLAVPVDGGLTIR
jgi:hypothetical protein